jgi:hypothetical protein
LKNIKPIVGMTPRNITSDFPQDMPRLNQSVGSTSRLKLLKPMDAANLKKRIQNSLRPI